VSASVLVGIGVLGGLGAMARFAVDGIVAEQVGRQFPFGTLAVNLSGALALGVLVGVAVHGDALRLAATGALGSFTTFSTWMLESHRLGEEGEPERGFLNLAASLAAGLAAVAVGRLIGGAL
jgi:CrcB protein